MKKIILIQMIYKKRYLWINFNKNHNNGHEEKRYCVYQEWFNIYSRLQLFFIYKKLFL